MRRILPFLALLLAGCASTPTAVQTAAGAQMALSTAIDLEVQYVRGEVRGAEHLAARDCAKGDTVCTGYAVQVAVAATAARSALARQAVEAGTRSADLIDQANRCADHDQACERYALEAAALQAALAGRAVAELRAGRQP